MRDDDDDNDDDDDDDDADADADADDDDGHDVGNIGLNIVFRTVAAKLLKRVASSFLATLGRKSLDKKTICLRRTNAETVVS